LYAEAETFTEVYERIAAEIVRLGQRGDVLYAVPGHPLVGEATTLLVQEKAAAEGIPVCVVPGLSFIEPVLAAVDVDPLAAGLQITDAMLVATAYHPPLMADRPAILGQLYNRTLASDVKLTLLNLYPDDHPVTLVRRAGLDDQQVNTFPLYELDRRVQFDHLTSLYLPPIKGAASYNALQEIMAHLRAPDGCPWDRKQTHQSLRTNLLEETYEVLAALDEDNVVKLREELGDLLMQIAMHVQIATEEGSFKLPDVVGGIVTKLVRRHPHVFGSAQVEGVDDVWRNWEAIKRRERAENGEERASLLDGVPQILPALTQAQAYTRRAARVGYRGRELSLVEVAELLTTLQSGDEVRAAEACGRLLFLLADMARQAGVDAETALREANARFARAVAEVEARATERGFALTELPPEEQATLWRG